MKQITVSGAIIIRNKELFATQRGYGDWKGWWEFPGGKLEAGETPEQCIEREIREELATEVKAEQILGVVEYDYPEFHLSMGCYWCFVRSGRLTLKEHESARWLAPDEMDAVAWLPPDRTVAERIRQAMAQAPSAAP